ncbi:MAG TPA: RNB domain-containing ribonuclease [Candidatus Limnocylindrales bacterium]|nr:RNB domain-containing ribonuclease [Candidatus Limnocylindrales bacterium]
MRDALSTHLLTILASARRPSSTVEQLTRATGMESGDIAASLDALERSGDVVRMPKHKWALAERSGMLTGRVKVERSGRALVILDVPDAPLVVERGALRPAMNGDRVLVEPMRYARGGLHHARIHRVLERRHQTIVGVASPIARRRLLPLDDRIGPYIVVLSDDSDEAPPKMAVAATILEYPTSHRDLVVRVDRVLGEVGKLATEIQAACLLREIDEEFSEEVTAEAAAFAEPHESDLEGRTDLRSMLTVTVDPVDAKDHDDAVAIEPGEDGGWRLVVSIADVSHYVRPGTRLDSEAYERSTSVYFPGCSIPMLPERLSGDLASLHPGVDRLTVSVFLDIDARGNVVDASFARSVIHSFASLTYEQVQTVLDEEGFRPASTRDDESDDAAAVDAAEDSAGLRAAVELDVHSLPAPTRTALVSMAECADALHRRRMKRGAIDMDLPEAVIELDETGEVRGIHRRPRRFAHRLVEEFMLAANEAVAERIDKAGAPFLYRIHERPDDEALTELATRVRALGLRLERDGGLVTPKMFQKLLAGAVGRPEARQINNMVLRTMTRARYSADKEIHFGLASRCYTHFTSPIRRYPDIIAHRALLAVEASRARSGKRAPEASSTETGATIPDFEAEASLARKRAGLQALPSHEALGPAGEHTSSRERRAMDAERDVVQAAGVLYMMRHVGRRLDGTVSGVDRWGFWVELDVAFVEGFVHIGKLREYFDYVAERMELQSRVSSAVIHIGQRVKVRVASVDLAARRIELEPA